MFFHRNIFIISFLFYISSSNIFTPLGVKFTKFRALGEVFWNGAIRQYCTVSRWQRRAAKLIHRGGAVPRSHNIASLYLASGHFYTFCMNKKEWRLYLLLFLNPALTKG